MSLTSGFESHWTVFTKLAMKIIYEHHPSVVFIFLETGTVTWRNCELLICDRH